MVFLMTLAVVPLGVLAALYLREYAKQGPLVRTVRIAVNNLAGVPSIVFGVFGLGFFVYFVGGTIDRLFFPEALPTPTFGTGGILWAALTLALLTVPVVIVATEEALAAVPRSMREGSLALGATKFQTILRVVLPAAAPGILTGLILAMARAAGEVAPLMMIGVVKLAPELPIDGFFPFFHLDRKFMHLGFHIYDVGFQSPNVEAAKPMVYTTTVFLLIDRGAAQPDRDHGAQPPAREVQDIGVLRTEAMLMTDPEAKTSVPDSGLRIRTEVQAEGPGVAPARDAAPDIICKAVNLTYGDNHVLHDITMDMDDRRVTALIGPSGCGKSTLLRCLNRMNDLIDNVRIWGEIRVKGLDINAPTTDVIEVRRRVGMVFQKSNPFPKSIYENVVYGLRIAGISDKADARRGLRAQPARRGAVGRGQGPPRRERARALRRPAAAPVHRARDRRRARGAADGRALLGARPDRDAQDRGADLRAQGEVHDRDRDPQPAAGGARLGQDGVLLARAAGGVRTDGGAVHRPRRTS